MFRKLIDDYRRHGEQQSPRAEELERGRRGIDNHDGVQSSRTAAGKPGLATRFLSIGHVYDDLDH